MKMTGKKRITMMTSIKEKLGSMVQKIKCKKALVGLQLGMAISYFMNPMVAEAEASGTSRRTMIAGITLPDLQTKINNLMKAVMLVEVGIVAGVFVVVCNKDIIVYISSSDEGEKKAALKNIKGKVPALIAALLMSELVTMIAGYFVSSVTMPS